MTSVHLAGEVYSDSGSSRVLESISGWFDGPSVRSDSLARPGGHGLFATQVFRGGRSVGLTLSRLCDGPSEAADAQDFFSSVFADGSLSELQVTDPAGRTTSASVRIAGQPLVRWFPTSGVVRALLEVEAPDPLRYADAISRTTGFAEQRGGLEFPLFTDGTTDTGFLEFGEQGPTGRVTLPAQPGTAPGHTQFLVRGPVPAFSIIRVETGKRITFARSVAAGDRLLIDSATGVALLNEGDVDYSGLLTYWEWEPIMPSEAPTFAFIPDGLAQAGTLTVIHRAAWW